MPNHSFPSRSRQVVAIAAGLSLLGVAGPLWAQESSSAPAPAPAPSFESVVEPQAPAALPQQRPVAIPVRGPAIAGAPTAPRRPACDAAEPMRDGFYLRIMQGMGYAKLSGSGPAGPLSASGLGAHSTIAIGGGLGRGLAIAGTLQSSSAEAELEGGPFADATISTGSGSVSASGKARFSQGLIGALVDWYPQPLGGFHGGLSVGFGAVSLANNADDSQLAGFASAGSLFVGYDTVISRTWGFGLALVASGVTSASLKNKDGEDSGYKLEGYAIGLAGSLLYF